MRHNLCELRVLVNGRAITEYPHDDQVYVEGRPGSQYTIELHNQHPWRIEAVLSVDGLAVTDGQPAGSTSRGYLIEPLGRISVPGWLVDHGRAARFTFADPRQHAPHLRQGYAEQVTGSAANNGVIGAMVFREAVPVVSATVPYWASGILYNGNPTLYGYNGNPTLYGGPAMTTQTGTSNSNATTHNTTRSASPAQSAMAMNASVMASAAPPALGTAFGAATAFATTAVAFRRGELLATLCLYYADARGLTERGVMRPRHRPRRPGPQAFPGLIGCAPPPGWSA